MLLNTFLLLLVSAVFGAVIGSFINVVAIRSHDGTSIRGRSHCMNCKKTLHARHLVPVLSYLWQRGRCTECGKKINPQYPLVEIFGAFLAVITVLRYIYTLDWLWMGYEFFFIMSLMIFVVTDIRWKELFLELMVGIGIVFSLYHMLLRVSAGESWYLVAWSHLLGFSFITLFFFFQWFVSRKRWIGAGDIWLGAVLGAVLGWPIAGVALYFAYLFGGGLALFLLLTKKIKAGARVPFAPALIAGTMAAMWWGDVVIKWITNAIS